MLGGYEFRRLESAKMTQGDMYGTPQEVDITEAMDPNTRAYRIGFGIDFVPFYFEVYYSKSNDEMMTWSFFMGFGG